MATEPTAHETAHFDQAYAEAADRLDDLLRVHRDLLADGEEKREVRIAGLAQWLITECDHPSIAQAVGLRLNVHGVWSGEGRPSFWTTGLQASGSPQAAETASGVPVPTPQPSEAAETLSGGAA